MESAFLRICQECEMPISEIHFVAELDESTSIPVYHLLKNESASPILTELYESMEEKEPKTYEDIINEYLSDLEKDIRPINSWFEETEELFSSIDEQSPPIPIST